MQVIFRAVNRLTVAPLYKKKKLEEIVLVVFSAALRSLGKTYIITNMSLNFEHSSSMINYSV